MKPGPLWQVEVRRNARATVLVKTDSPELARKLATGLVTDADFETTQTTHAYVFEGAPRDRWWNGEWVYPETGLL